MSRRLTFTDQVIRAAEMLGWMVYHVRPAKTAHGWRTPVQGVFAAGFPDLVMVKGARVVYAELKGATNGLEPGQEMWRDALLAAGQEWHLWRLSQWDEVLAVLKGGTR